jgi:hypothetical protein
MLANIRSFVSRRGRGEEAVVEVGFVHALWDMATMPAMSDYSLVVDDRFLCASIVYGLSSAWKKEPRDERRDEWFRRALAYLVQRWNHRLHAGWDWCGVEAITKQWYDMQSKWGSPSPRRPPRGDGAEDDGGAGADAHRRGRTIVLEVARDGKDHADLGLHIRILASLRDRFHDKLSTDQQRRSAAGRGKEDRPCCQNSLCAKRTLSDLVLALEGLRDYTKSQGDVVMTGHDNHTSTVIRAVLFDAPGSPDDGTEWLCRLLFGEETSPGPRRVVKETDGLTRLRRTCAISQTLGDTASIDFLSVEPRSILAARAEKEKKENEEAEGPWTRRDTRRGRDRGRDRWSDDDEDDGYGPRDGPFSVVRGLIKRGREDNKRRRSRMRCTLWCCCVSLCKLFVFLFCAVFSSVVLYRLVNR